MIFNFLILNSCILQFMVNRYWVYLVFGHLWSHIFSIKNVVMHKDRNTRRLFSVSLLNNWIEMTGSNHIHIKHINNSSIVLISSYLPQKPNRASRITRQHPREDSVMRYPPRTPHWASGAKQVELNKPQRHRVFTGITNCPGGREGRPQDSQRLWEL